MENTYGIGVQNRYHLFLDEESDPLELLKIQEQEKELRKKNKVAEKENKGKSEVKSKPVSAVPRKGIKESQNVKTQEVKPRDEKKSAPRIANDRHPFERPPRVAGDNREERNNRRNREDRPQNGPADKYEKREDRPPRRDPGERREINDRRDFGERREFTGERREFIDRGDGVDRRRGGIGGGRGRGGGNGPRGPRAFDDRGKRHFDRQSGSDRTGIKAVDKREGGGAHNWGTHKDDIVDLNKSGQSDQDAPWELTEKAVGGAVPTSTEKEPFVEVVEVPAVPVEEEPKELTLDEWKAQKAGRQKPAYNLRKAGEGEDLTIWKKMYPIEKKKEGEEGDSDDELEYDAADYPQRVGRQKRVLGIEVHFNDARRGGGMGRGRGTRGGAGGRGGLGRAGGPRGERPPGGPGRNNVPGFVKGEESAEREEKPIVERGEPVSARGRQNAPKVDDEHDFPSLGDRS